MSSPPWRSTIRSSAASTDAVSVMSSRAASATPPSVAIPSAVAVAASALTSRQQTVAP